MARTQINPILAARELALRTRIAFARGRERAALERFASEPAHLRSEFAELSSAGLLEHFRQRPAMFFRGFEDREATAELQRKLYPPETRRLIEAAELICQSPNWPSIGGGVNSNWRQDPVSGLIWPLDYHADVRPQANYGSDIRALWEINRLSHFITLACAFAVTGEQKYPTTLLAQFDSWLAQNPLGRGPNWNCAMEVALRAINLLAAFTVCRHAQEFSEVHLSRWLQSLEQHGAHIKRNLEFSHMGTSNHYLTDVVGLLWLGLVLPELSAAEEWREWGLQQLLSEMDKQVLPDGADYEGATGYHRFVLELFLFSFILCRQQGIGIDQRYWNKLRTMLSFLQAYVRPDGRAPLIGDSDGTQLLPITPHAADDHNYLLSIGALATNEAVFKAGTGTEEIIWLLGETGCRENLQLGADTRQIRSRDFRDVGMYILRHDDLFLLFNAARHLRAGRSSHRHNDALSLEVSACGRAFIVDPGTYVYSAELPARHAFRSTAYHSTVQIDDEEQNVINESRPFLFGNDAKPTVTHWETTSDYDRVIGAHVGYERLPGRVRHQRSITFYKNDRWWLVEDQLTGRGTHKITTRFHLAEGLDIDESKGNVTACDPEVGATLLIIAFDGEHSPEFEKQFVSRAYGSRTPSITVNWTSSLKLPCTLRWGLVPICKGEDEQERRLVVARQLAQIVS